MDKKVSIIIPAYNEEKRLGNYLKEIIDYTKKTDITFEILVVNDGSIDSTSKIVTNFRNDYPDNNIILIENTQNMGKGYSVKRGMLEATGNYSLFTDADGSTPIKEIEKLLDIVQDKKFEIAIGSRTIKGANVEKRQNIIRQSMGKIFNKIIKSLTGLKFEDTQCGFKLFTSAAKNKIFPLQKLNHFSFDVEILFIAKKNQIPIKEVPIRWINSPDSKVKIVKDSLKMFRDVFKIRLNDIRGLY